MRPLPVLSFFGARPRQQSANFEVLFHRERWKDLAALRHLPDAEIADPVAGPAEDVFAAKQNTALRRAINAGDRANKRCFAGSIGADDGNDGALFDVERYAVERLHIVIKHIESFDTQHQTGSAPR